MVKLGLNVGGEQTSQNESEAIEPRNYYLNKEVEAIFMVADKIVLFALVRTVQLFRGLRARRG